MLNLIQADLFKLRKSQAIKIMLAITTASAALMAVMAYLIPKGEIEGRMTGIGFMFSDINMISILGAVVASIFVCGDFDNKTIQDAVASGSGRGAIVGGKAAILAIVVALLLLPYAIVTGIALGTGNEFGMDSVALGFLNLLTTEGGAALSAAEIGKLALVMLTLTIVYAAQLSICIPLAFMLKKPVFVVAIYYGFSILSAQLMGLSDSSPLFDSLFSSTPYGGSHVFITLDTGAGDMIKSVVVSILFIAVMIAATYAVFKRSEMK